MAADNQKTTFIMMDEWGDLLEELDRGQRGDVLTAIYSYRQGIDIPMDGYDALTRTVIKYIIGQLKKNDDRYEEKCAQNRKNGNKGGRPPKDKSKPNGFSKNPIKPNGFSENPIKPNGFSENPYEIDYEYDYEIDYENDNDYERESEGESGHKPEGTVAEPLNNLSEPCNNLALPCKDGSLYPVPPEKIAEWQEAYPAVDVLQELKCMKSWLDANPIRGKTARGMPRFIVNWLSAANSKVTEKDNGNPKKPREPDPFEGLDFSRFNVRDD